MEKRFVYADHAATAPVSDRALAAMLPFLKEGYGNPSSRCKKGREAAAALKKARRQVADILLCEPDEIFFTSGGTESDNWAVKGTALSFLPEKPCHIITTQIEHHAVLNSCRAARRMGCEVTYIGVDGEGYVDPADIAAAIRPDTALVSVMAANNEVGTIEPIDEIGALCRERDIIFHTDAVQAVGHIPFSLRHQPIDMLSLSGHKFGAPKGVGALFVRDGVKLCPLLDGGGQERSLRSGTENVAGAAALAAALDEAVSSLGEDSVRITRMRNRLISALLAIPGTVLNGSTADRLPGNVSICFEEISAPRLLAALDVRGIAASAGSACSAGKEGASHVLTAMGVPAPLAAGSLRLSLGRDNSDEDIDHLIAVISETVENLRRLSLYRL